MPKAGDKYIIEIEEVIQIRKKESFGFLYRVKGFRTLVFDLVGLDKLKKYDPDAAYKRGLDDAWEAARKISKMSNKEQFDCFDNHGMANVLDYNTAAEDLEKLRTYEEQKKADEEIRVGDEITVSVHSPNRTIKVIVYNISKCGLVNVYCTVSFDSGECFTIAKNREVKKTGRHFPQVAELLAALGGADSE
ncbi:MAG: hypothetical protein IJ740_03435 [Ruminococcus sp.]|nr:hypothetical protein [Ruminococcus sp.]